MPRPAADPYDYTSEILRSDSFYAPTIVDEPASSRPDFEDLEQGETAALLSCILGIWVQFAISPSALAAMAGVLAALLDQLERRDSTFYDAETEDLHRFIVTNPDRSRPGLEDQELRRNVVNGTILALEGAGMIHKAPLMARPNKLSTNSRRPSALGVRPCSHDEMLLIRLATRLVATTHTGHLSAAATALCSATATASEVPQVLWTHWRGTRLELPGRPDPQRRRHAEITHREVTLDSWQVEALDLWSDEQNRRRPINPTESITYSGRQALTSNSAAISADNQVRKAIVRAGLATVPGISAGSLRLWGAVCNATDLRSAAAGARRAGINLDTLDRQIGPGQ